MNIQEFFSKRRSGAGRKYLAVNSRGITLIEIMIVVAILGVLATLAVSGLDSVNQQKLTSAAREFMADLQQLRQNSMTRSAAANSRGFGIRFNSNTTYTLFEFDDQNNNFTDDAGLEESGPLLKNLQALSGTLSSSVTVTLGNAGDPTGSVLIYDKRGMPRTTAWGIAPSSAYVFRIPSVTSTPPCVLIDQIRVRDGRWNGANCVVK